MFTKKKTDIENKKQQKEVLEPKKVDKTNRRTEIQTILDQESQRLRQIILTEVEPEVLAQYEEKQREKEEARIKAEEEARIKAEEEAAREKEEKAKLVESNQEPQQEIPREEIPQPDPDPPEKTEEEKRKLIEDEKTIIRDGIVDKKIQENSLIISLKNDIQNFDTEINDITKQITDFDNAIRDLEQYINFDFGPDARFAYLNDQTYTLNAAEYVYTLKPFKDIIQGHVRVGNWDSFQNDYKELKFDHGERCWGGPDRSMLVTLQCGGETQLMEVKEPNKCEYAMIMKTPGACLEEGLLALKNKINRK